MLLPAATSLLTLLAAWLLQRLFPQWEEGSLILVQFQQLGVQILVHSKDGESIQLAILLVQEATAGHILHGGQICNPQTVKQQIRLKYFLLRASHFNVVLKKICITIWLGLVWKFSCTNKSLKLMKYSVPSNN